MLVNRRTFAVKRGCMEEAVALFVADRERIGGTHRIYVSVIGAFDVIAIEIEVENMEAYEKGWAEWSATPEAAALQKKLNDLTERGGSNEIWMLAE